MTKAKPRVPIMANGTPVPAESMARAARLKAQGWRCARCAQVPPVVLPMILVTGTTLHGEALCPSCAARVQ
jgi:hypothetical protein